MTVISRSALVSHTPLQMYSLVNDVEAYPQFLPWCHGSQVLSRDEDEVRATLNLARGGVHKSFTTCNRLQPGKMIEMRLLEGPFKHLEGFWRFEAIGDGGGCRVSFDLEFEFSNMLVGLAFGPVFSQIANTLVDSFCKRADDVFGQD